MHTEESSFKGGIFIEGSSKSDEGKLYENIFAILIALAAATSGLAGFLSSEADGMAVDASNISLKWQGEATFSYDRAMQIMLHDQQLLSDANVQETLGDINHDMTYYSIAEELRSMANCVRSGYIDVDGTGSYAYDDDIAQAWLAYTQNMLADYNNFMKLSDKNTAISNEKGGDASAYLLATVVLAFGAVVGAAGTTLSQKWIRLLMLAIVMVIIVVSVIYILII